MTTIWDYLVELRKELVEAQKIRAQIIGFKITFLTAAYGYLFSNIKQVNPLIFLLPTTTAFLFDYLINSYSFSIKRIGVYIQHLIEPELPSIMNLKSDYLFWQTFLSNRKTRQIMSNVSNFGLSLLTLIPTYIIFIQNDLPCGLKLIILLFLIILVVIDIYAFKEHQKLSSIFPSA